MINWILSNWNFVTTTDDWSLQSTGRSISTERENQDKDLKVLYTVDAERLVRRVEEGEIVEGFLLTNGAGSDGICCLPDMFLQWVYGVEAGGLVVC